MKNLRGGTVCLCCMVLLNLLFVKESFAQFRSRKAPVTTSGEINKEQVFRNKTIREKDIDEKFYRSVNMALDPRTGLELNEEQTARIRSLAADVRKNVNKQEEAIQTLTVEINTLMWESPYDVAAVNELVEQKYNIQKKKEMLLISAYHRLFDEILTSAQAMKLKRGYSHSSVIQDR